MKTKRQKNAERQKDAETMKRLAAEAGERTLLYVKVGWEESAFQEAYLAAMFAHVYLDLVAQ